MPHQPPQSWRTLPGALENYRRVREEAQRLAKRYNHDYGIEANDYEQKYRYFMLPRPENRSGHELRCEVVHP